MIGYPGWFVMQGMNEFCRIVLMYCSVFAFSVFIRLILKSPAIIVKVLSCILFSASLRFSLKWVIPFSALGCLYIQPIIAGMLFISRLTHILSISQFMHLHLFFRFRLLSFISLTFLKVSFLISTQAPPFIVFGLSRYISQSRK